MSSEETGLDRWTPDGVDLRDATLEGGARPRAERELGRFVPELVDLGFVELGFECGRIRAEDDERPPEVTEQVIRSLEEAADQGAVSDEDRLVWARELRALQRMVDGDQLSWVWSHPDTHDIAVLEHSDHGDWLAFRRVFADGSVVRTLRRPDAMPVGAPAATGPFVDTPVPGLYALLCWLAGDGILIGRGPKPLVRQWDQVVGSVDAAATLRAHHALLSSVALVGPAAPASMALVVASGRRTLHVSAEGLELSHQRAGQALVVGRALAGLAAWGVVSWGTGAWMEALLAAVLAPWAATRWWTVLSGQGPLLRLFLPTAVLLFWGTRIGPGLAAGAFGGALLATSAAWLVCFWLGLAGRRHFDPRQASPPAVSADAMLTHYRD